jgi:hypothetical protein
VRPARASSSTRALIFALVEELGQLEASSFRFHGDIKVSCPPVPSSTQPIDKTSARTGREFDLAQ